MEEKIYGYLRAAYHDKFDVRGIVKSYDYNSQEWIVDIQGVNTTQPFNKNIQKYRTAPEDCVGKTMSFIVS